jgi:hypothetical protein
MPDLLGVTSPVPGRDNTNVNRNVSVSPNDPRVQNAPDPSRVSRADNRTERQDSADTSRSDIAPRYGSNFHTFLQRLSNAPSLSQSLSEVLSSYQGALVSSGMEEGISAEIAALLNMLKMDEGQLTKFLLSQMKAGNRFSGAFFSILRDAYTASRSDLLRGAILQFLKRYSDYSSSRHIEGNLLRTLTKLTRAIPASYGSQLLPLAAQLEEALNRGDRAGGLKLLQGTIIPFLADYTSRTNDMGLSRALISMLTLDTARYENAGREELLQAFRQLNTHSMIKDRLGAFSDEALLRLIDGGSFAKTAQHDPFAAQLAQTAQQALQGGAGTEAQEAFHNIVSAFLVNESVYMPLNHVIIPLEWNEKMMFSELWVDPDAEDNLKRGRSGRDNTIRFLLKIDIQSLGLFDLVLNCHRDSVDLRLYCPEQLAPFTGIVQGELSRILSENGMEAASVQVQTMEKPLSISSVFPRIFEGENSVNVKV